MAIAAAYGMTHPDAADSSTVRATFVIDKNGTVVDTFATANLGTARDKAAYDAALAKL